MTKEISSSAMVFVQAGAFSATAVVLCVQGIRLLPQIPLPGFLLCLGAIVVIWWAGKLWTGRKKVFLDSKGLRISSARGSQIIPFTSITSVEKLRFYRRPPLTVEYQDIDGNLKNFQFFPSIQVGGFLFTADHVRQLLLDRVEDVKAAADGVDANDLGSARD